MTQTQKVLLTDLGHITAVHGEPAERGFKEGEREGTDAFGRPFKDDGRPVGDDVLGQMATGVCRDLLRKCVTSLKECESVAHHWPDCATEVEKLDEALASLKVALAA